MPTGNPTIDNAQKALHDLYLAHHAEGDHMYGVLHGYAIRSGGESAQQKEEALALIVILLANGHISQWAGQQFEAYLALTPKQINDAGGLAPAQVNPATIDKSLGSSLKNTPQNLANAAGVGGILAPFFQANIWIRVAEVALGLILIAVGIAKMTNAVPIATKIAGAVA